jgi:hypothetical protein
VCYALLTLRSSQTQPLRKLYSKFFLFSQPQPNPSRNSAKTQPSPTTTHFQPSFSLQFYPHPFPHPSNTSKTPLLRPHKRFTPLPSPATPQTLTQNSPDQPSHSPTPAKTNPKPSQNQPKTQPDPTTAYLKFSISLQSYSQPLSARPPLF